MAAASEDVDPLGLGVDEVDEEFSGEYVEAGEDRRSVAILTDRERMEFLANIERTQAAAWSKVAKWYRDWWVYCGKRAALEDDGSEDERYWDNFAARWRARLEAWEKELVLTASIGGKRSEQIVEAIRGRGGEDPGEGVNVTVNPNDNNGGKKGGGGFFFGGR